jgi:hypothetical protein
VVIDHYTNIRPLLANALNLRTVGLADHRPVASLIMSDVVRLHAIGDEFKSTLVPHPLPAVNRSFIKAAWADISACFQRCTETNRTGGRLSSGYSPAPCAPGEPAAAMTRLVHSARLIGHVSSLVPRCSFPARGQGAQCLNGADGRRTMISCGVPARSYSEITVIRKRSDHARSAKVLISVSRLE